MGFGKLIKPTKQKVKGFVIFLVGIIAFHVANTLILNSLSRSWGVEKYTAFMSGWTYPIISLSLLIVWFYILISIIYLMAKKKS